MGESGYFPFHIRLELAKMFEAWADEHKVEKCAENVIAYLTINDLLSYREIRDFLKAASDAKDGAE
jgi:hypothetical protein